MISGSLPPMMCGVGDYTNKLIDALKKNPELKLGVITSKEASMWNPPGGIDTFPIMNNWSLSDSFEHFFRREIFSNSLSFDRGIADAFLIRIVFLFQKTQFINRGNSSLNVG